MDMADVAFLFSTEEEPKEDWNWDFNDDDVRIEREEGLARIETARAHLRAQENVMRNINAKLQEQDSVPTYAPGGLQAFMMEMMRSGSRAGSRAGSASQAHSWGSSIASPEQQRSALVVADNIIRRQERVLESDRLRREVLEKERQSRERTIAELKAADTRCAQRAEANLQEQRRRAFAAQQRQAEQQKAHRELQREQIKIQEAYYAKKTPSRPSGTPFKQALEPPPSAPPSREAFPDDFAGDEDIYRTTLRSHTMYAGTMERWNKFVNENERRTEAHWRKILGSSNQDLGIHARNKRRTCRRTLTGSITPIKRFTESKKASNYDGSPFGTVDASDTPDKNSSRKASVKVSLSDAGSARGSASWASPTNEQQSSSVGFAKPALASPSNTFGGSTQSFFNKTAPAPNPKSSLPNLTTWEVRRQQCHEAIHMPEVKYLAKVEQDKANSKEAQSRAARIKKEQTEKIVKRNQLWEERQNRAASWKAAQESSNEELLRKQEETSQKRVEEMQRQQHEQRDESMGAKVLLARNVQKAARLFKEKTTEVAKKQQAEKEAAAAQNYQNKLAELTDQDKNEKHAEQARLVAERKESLDKEFRKQALAEIAKKEARSAEVIGHQRRPPLQQQRTKHKTKSMDRPASTPCLHRDLELAELPPPIDVISPEFGLERRPSLDSIHTADTEDPRVFLKELEEKSAGWLREMRGKKDVQPWKPF